MTVGFPANPFIAFPLPHLPGNPQNPYWAVWKVSVDTTTHGILKLVLLSDESAQPRRNYVVFNQAAEELQHCGVSLSPGQFRRLLQIRGKRFSQFTLRDQLILNRLKHLGAVKPRTTQVHITSCAAVRELLRRIQGLDHLVSAIKTLDSLRPPIGATTVQVTTAQNKRAENFLNSLPVHKRPTPSSTGENPAVPSMDSVYPVADPFPERRPNHQWPLNALGRKGIAVPLGNKWKDGKVAASRDLPFNRERGAFDAFFREPEKFTTGGGKDSSDDERCGTGYAYKDTTITGIMSTAQKFLGMCWRWRGIRWEQLSIKLFSNQVGLKENTCMYCMLSPPSISQNTSARHPDPIHKCCL